MKGGTLKSSAGYSGAWGKGSKHLSSGVFPTSKKKHRNYLHSSWWHVDTEKPLVCSRKKEWMRHNSTYSRTETKKRRRKGAQEGEQGFCSGLCRCQWRSSSVRQTTVGRRVSLLAETQHESQWKLGEAQATSLGITWILSKKPETRRRMVPKKKLKFCELTISIYTLCFKWSNYTEVLVNTYTFPTL